MKLAKEEQIKSQESKSHYELKQKSMQIYNEEQRKSANRKQVLKMINK